MNAVWSYREDVKARAPKIDYMMILARGWLALGITSARVRQGEETDECECKFLLYIYNGARDIVASICDPTWGQHKSYGVSGDGPMGRMLMSRLYNHAACPVHAGRGSSGLVSKVASFLLHTPSSANARKLVASWPCVRRSDMGRRSCGRNC
jgi:hypothetical protein